MENRQEFYNECRNKYKTFTYKAYSYELNDDNLVARFSFSIDGLSEFSPVWTINRIGDIAVSDIDKDALDRAVFSLGMTELISYWKITCAPTVVIECGALCQSQIDWWKKLYWGGLGEFFYVNGITETIDSFMSIISKGIAPDDINISVETLETEDVPVGVTPKVLIPIGGGKSSAVSLELMKNHADTYCFIINPRGATIATALTAELDDKCIRASRSLDDRMLELNAQGFLNGHTPYNAIVAFSSSIAAYINGIPYVALSHESTTDEVTITNVNVNHQYSESFEFEQDYRAYEDAVLKTGVYYFSFLRPLSELQIAMLFAKMKQYHSIFRSCNVGSKQDIWCGSCSKCLFVYILLYPFLSVDELDNIFHKRLFEDESLIEDFDKLCGIIPDKPFECVGSRDEVNACLTIAIISIQKDRKPLPVLLSHYFNAMDQAGAYRLTTSLAVFQELTNSISLSHGLPPYFMSIINEAF